MDLRRKLFVSHLALALVVACLCLGVALQVARMALIQRASHQLDSVRTLKKLKIEGILDNYRSYLSLFQGDADSVSEKSLRDFLKTSPFAADYFGARVETRTGKILFDTTTDVDGDWLHKLEHSPVFREAKCDTGRRRVPCLLLGRAISGGYLVLQIRMRALEQVLATHAGLGQTGESYLVNRSGYFQTASRFWDEERTSRLAIDSEPWRKACAGQTAVSTERDYRGVPVLSSYTLVERDGVRWALLSEIDQAEVLEPLRSMRRLFLACLLAIAAVVALLARLTSRRIAGPVQASIDEQRLRQVGLYEGQELERRRVARELHDGIGQLLTALSFKISAANSDPALKLEPAIQDVISEVRKISNQLMPGVLSQLGLLPALRRLCDETTESSSLSCELTIKDEEKLQKLGKKLQHHVYRMCQEGIHNVIKHARTSQCQVKIESTAQSLLLEISDDGAGMPQSIRSGGGLSGLRERAEALGGSLQIRTKAGHGTALLMTIPLEKESEWQTKESAS